MKRIKLDLLDCYVYFLWMMVVHRLENSAIVVINGFAKNTLQLSWAVREPMIYVILAVMPHLAFTPINHVIFTASYGKWSGREYEVSTYADNVMFIPQDYFAYIVCHLLYLIPYMAAQLLIYFAMWRLVGRKHASMRGAANNPC